MAIGASRAVTQETPDGFVAPWRCSGHPEPTLPWRGHGATITADLVAFDWVRAAFLNGAPPEARPRDRLFPDAWVARITFIFTSTPVAEDLHEAVAACLTDTEPLVRRRAIAFALRFPHEAAAARVRSLLEHPAPLFRDVPDPTGAGTLEDALVAVLGYRAELRTSDGDVRDPAARRLLFERVLFTPAGFAALNYAARIDPEALLTHASRIAATSPQAPSALLRAVVFNRVREAIPVARVLLKKGLLPSPDVRSLFEHSSHPDRLAALAEFQ